MLRLDFDATGGICRIYDDDGNRNIRSFRIAADLDDGKGAIAIDGREYLVKEIYVNAKEVIADGSGTDHGERAGEAPEVDDVHRGIRRRN